MELNGGVCIYLQKQDGCNALRTFCFCWREPSASGATGGRLEAPKYEGRGWLLLAARGWRGFLFVLHGYYLKVKQLSHAHKNHDSPEAGGDQQASQTWAAGGLRVAERNVAGMKRKDVERSEALKCNAGEMSKATCRTE
jgi:hypothetical protein